MKRFLCRSFSRWLSISTTVYHYICVPCVCLCVCVCVSCFVCVCVCVCVRVSLMKGGEDRDLRLSGHVGFDSFPDQLVTKCVNKGFDFNILCIGKTTRSQCAVFLLSYAPALWPHGRAVWEHLILVTVLL